MKKIKKNRKNKKNKRKKAERQKGKNMFREIKEHKIS